jgi:hypothetical protein
VLSSGAQQTELSGLLGATAGVRVGCGQFPLLPRSIVVTGACFNAVEIACPVDEAVWYAKTARKAKATLIEVFDMKAPR